MQSITDLRSAADKERRTAEGLRKDAQKQRDKANTYKPDDDQQPRMNALDAAQASEERAAQHEQAAIDYEQQAADLEAQALDLEKQKQELQKRMQSEIDQLDQQEKTIRG